jgi:hypothetical protein
MLSQMYVEPDKGKNYLCIDWKLDWSVKKRQEG